MAIQMQLADVIVVNYALHYFVRTRPPPAPAISPLGSSAKQALAEARRRPQSTRWQAGYHPEEQYPKDMEAMFKQARSSGGRSSPAGAPVARPHFQGTATLTHPFPSSSSRSTRRVRARWPSSATRPRSTTPPSGRATSCRRRRSEASCSPA